MNLQEMLSRLINQPRYAEIVWRARIHYETSQDNELPPPPPPLWPDDMFW